MKRNKLYVSIAESYTETLLRHFSIPYIAEKNDWYFTHIDFYEYN